MISKEEYQKRYPDEKVPYDSYLELIFLFKRELAIKAKGLSHKMDKSKVEVLREIFHETKIVYLKSR